ncbi:MAG: DUF1311 domain-containing protein [Phreatobacter sp.]|uniref:lysozyme inhibitor LprI family protein n=1 Tax=Phreatobacter sp. TaxID=1966341 RepID=UPI001A58E2DF|nr:lysozyme inhibitor LprI family protein [Phreatobacter sp.]MBL8569672.1 DUF1311 domain-containing protein [Phreatobacter sp.]
MRIFGILVLATAAALTTAPTGAAQAASPVERQRECPASLPAEARRDCLARINAEADAALDVARRDALRAIADWNGNIDAGGKAEWGGEFERLLGLWTSFRDGQCAPALVGFERNLGAGEAEHAGAACRAAMTRVIVADLTNRFGEALPDLGRASFASGARGPNRRELIGAEGRQPLCRHPGRGGDYQPLTECYRRQARRVDHDLNTVWRDALAAIRTRPGLDDVKRAAWAEALRAAQRPWAELRDLACTLEAYETPNRFANSVYSQVTGPCLVVETEARTRDLKRAYGLP